MNCNVLNHMNYAAPNYHTCSAAYLPPAYEREAVPVYELPVYELAPVYLWLTSKPGEYVPGNKKKILSISVQWLNKEGTYLPTTNMCRKKGLSILSTDNTDKSRENIRRNMFTNHTLNKG